MVLDGSGHGVEGLEPSQFHVIVPVGQFGEGHSLDFAALVDPGKGSGQLVGWVAVEEQLGPLVFQIDGFSTVGDPHFLDSLVEKLLDMEAVGDQLGFGEAPAHDPLHAGGHIQGHFLHIVSFGFGDFP